MKIISVFALAAAAFVVSHPVLAQSSYPSKPIKMVVPFPPGGTSDFVGRVVGAELAKVLGQPVIVENLPGAAGVIGTVSAGRATPDGYTILLASSDLTIVPSVQVNPAFDPVSDFAPVGRLLTYSHYLVANVNVEPNNVAELIAAAQAGPGDIYYASGGIGGSNHMAAERFQSFADIELTHVPYNGNGPAITDLVADRVQLLWTSLPPVQGFVESGQLKLIGQTSANRSADTPDVPTFDESGLEGYELNNWYGVLAPAGVPDDIVEQLNAALLQTMSSPEVLEKLSSLGGEAAVNSPAEFGALIDAELISWREIARDAGVAIQ